MSEAKKFIMTYEGVKKLESELEYLKTVIDFVRAKV